MGISQEDSSGHGFELEDRTPIDVRSGGSPRYPRDGIATIAMDNRSSIHVHGDDDSEHLSTGGWNVDLAMRADLEEVMETAAGDGFAFSGLTGRRSASNSGEDNTGEAVPGGALASDVVEFQFDSTGDSSLSDSMMDLTAGELRIPPSPQRTLDLTSRVASTPKSQ